MKTNYRKLQLLISFGIINPEDFYALWLDEYEIYVQADKSDTLVQKYITWDRSDDVRNGYMVFNKKNVNVVLT